MQDAPHRDLCWVPIWNSSRSGIGLEHVRVSAGSADSILMTVDEDDVPFRLIYQLHWNDCHLLRRADLKVHKGSRLQSLSLCVDDSGCWRDEHGEHLVHLDGCVDIDI